MRNATHNGVGVFASDVLIENCRIHHLLQGSFKDQRDAHGITGRPHRLTIRNCEIYYVSGDALQFCPDREPWDDVLVENCVFWTGPLPEDAAGFKKGERPGENALDTKQNNRNSRSKMIFRNTVCYGWKQPGQIGLMAALNIKNKVEVRVENCVFFDNEVCLRLRGSGSYEGAWVTVENCLFYDSQYGIRAEDSIEKMKLLNSGYGDGVGRRFRAVSGKPKDARIEGDHDAHYYALYLTPRLSEGSLIAVSDVWGHYHSRVIDNFELISQWDSQHAALEGSGDADDTSD